MKNSDNRESLAVGGQAVMEGVMMRSRNALVLACRTPGGKIAVSEQKWKTVFKTPSLYKIPFIRGILIFAETLVNGMGAITLSANLQIRYSEDPDEKEEEISGGSMVAVIGVSILFALGLFVILPHFLTALFGLKASSLKFHLLDGVFKISILILYLWAIGLFKDMKRLFMYHGAEHKSIFTYEKGLDLTVDNAKKCSRYHPRCGTSFLFLVLFISIFVFLITLKHQIVDNKWLDHLIKVGIKLPLMFPIAGIGYELIRLSGKHGDKAIFKPLVAPGLLLQRLTTREPDEEILEIALASLKRTLYREEHPEEEPSDEIVLYDNLSQIPSL
ncbi:MAG: DUF1385 domain-containing protein [Deltaproteobacteria bacterium]|nr:DUF1385 domain-containing protein [Deltaproteobacteria bacterium]